jgi:copper chaperone NosL
MVRMLLIFFASVTVLSACKNEMRPIEYGKDNCEQCRMTVMDPQFAAGMLSSKGKVLTFDAGECLFRYLKAKGINERDQYFVSDYNHPGTLLDALTANYLHGDSIQSPMGGNLAAFHDLNAAKAAQESLGGEILSWKDMFSKK